MASSELLKQIQAGKRLKKTETNDRSAPAIESKHSGGGAGPRVPMSAPPIPSSAGPPQLGGLFASGMPKLKPAGQGNLAKPPALGKPPVVHGRAAPSPALSAPPPSRVMPPKPSIPAPPPHAPTPPARAAPTLPSRPPTIPARAPPPPAHVSPSPPPAVPVPARRPPPLPRAASPSVPSQAPPPIRPPPSVAVRSASPANTSSLPTRAVPPPPTRSNGIPIPPARKAPPPPPARPSSISSPSPSRAPPPPPARRVPIPDGPSALPLHMRALSDTESSAPPPPPRVSPARTSFLPAPVPSSSQRSRVVSTPSPPEVPSRLSIALPDRQMNGTRRSPPSRKIPSPPPEVGSHKFPTSVDFPPPRQFIPNVKHYNGGRQRGSEFNLSNI